MNQDSSHPDNSRLMKNASHTQPAKPWYRHFWVWFVILLPASSVVAGITTVIIAFNNADERVADNWYKDGRGINKTRQEEKRADKMDLSATLNTRDGRAVVLFDQAKSVSAPSLQLALRHPTLAERDQVLRLVREAPGRYSAPVGLPDGRWVATLEPEPGDWRIRQRLDLHPDDATTLKAAPW